MSLQSNIKAAQIDLIVELGIDKLPEERQKELLTQIGEVMQQRVVLRLLEELPEEKKEEFGKILEENQDNMEPIEAFLKENISDLENIILDEIGKYKQEAKQFLEQAMGGQEKDKGNEV